MEHDLNYKYKVDDELTLKDIKYRVAYLSSRKTYYLTAVVEFNDYIFTLLDIKDKFDWTRKIVPNIKGDEYSDFPECNSLEDLNKLIKELKKEIILQECKKRFPPGTKVIPSHMVDAKDSAKWILVIDDYKWIGDNLLSLKDGLITSADEKYGNTEYLRLLYGNDTYAKIYEESLNFIEGKWYKNMGQKKNYIAKFAKIENGVFYAYEYIDEGIFHKYEGHSESLTSYFKDGVECTLEEIQQYLPEGHLDKTIVYENILDINVGDTVKCTPKCMSKCGIPGVGFSPNLEFVVTKIESRVNPEGKFNIYFGGEDGHGVFSDTVKLVKRKESTIPLEPYKYSPIPNVPIIMLEVIKDLKSEDISSRLPIMIPKGSITWTSVEMYKDGIRSGYIYIENNRYSANIPHEYFKEVNFLSDAPSKTNLMANSVKINLDTDNHLTDLYDGEEYDDYEDYRDEDGEFSITKLHEKTNPEQWLRDHLTETNTDIIHNTFKDDDYTCNEIEVLGVIIGKHESTNCGGLDCDDCIFHGGNRMSILENVFDRKKEVSVSFSKIVPSNEVKIKLINVPRI